MGLVETEAFVLRTYRLAEADKIVVCLTRDAGVVRGVARGARRLKSRFGAGLEPFTLVSLSFYAKEGRELVSLRSAEILRSYFGLSGNPETVAALEYLCELALEFAPPHDPNEKLFRMVRACLEAIAEAPSEIQTLTRYYELWTLKLSGFLPELRACGACRASLNPRETAYVGLENSLRCRACAGGAGLPVSPEAREHWRQMSRKGPGEWAEGFRQLPQASQNELAQLTQRLIARALERVPRGQPAASLSLS